MYSKNHEHKDLKKNHWLWFHRNWHKVHPTFKHTSNKTIFVSVSLRYFSNSALLKELQWDPFLYVICSLYMKLHVSILFSRTETQTRKSRSDMVISLVQVSTKLFLWTAKNITMKFLTYLYCSQDVFSIASCLKA